MKKSKLGQHTIEYSMLLVIIMMGIIIGGPYVVRSWNGNLQGWEDSMIDSVNDPLIQALPTGSAPVFCTCENFTSITCGATTDVYSGSVTCGEEEMLWKKSCYPLNCELSDASQVPTAECLLDSTCCTAKSPDPLVDVINPATDCGANASPPCSDGEFRQDWSCGGVPQTGCLADITCAFSCENPLVPVLNGTTCPGDDSGLSGDVNTTLLLPGTACGIDKCEVVCDNCYYPDGPACVIPQPNTYFRGTCPAGQFDATGCPSGQIIACTC